ncbi:hypothetical protein ACFLWA_11060 [Chloroflexota bacterium]
MAAGVQPPERPSHQSGDSGMGQARIGTNHLPRAAIPALQVIRGVPERTQAFDDQMSGGERLYWLWPIPSLALETATFDLISSAGGIVVAVRWTRYDILGGCHTASSTGAFRYLELSMWPI